MFHKKFISKVYFEIEQIDKLLKKYEGLIAKTKKEKPGMIEVTALASVLHSFYNGLENIFLIIVKEVDKKRPSTRNWHKELLNQVSKENDIRNQVISKNTKEIIADYLGFRHFYRHAYSFYLDWDEMEGLIGSIFEIWKEVRIELENFLEDNE